jgi:hypothetical protein
MTLEHMRTKLVAWAIAFAVVALVIFVMGCLPDDSAWPALVPFFVIASVYALVRWGWL